MPKNILLYPDALEAPAWMQNFFQVKDIFKKGSNDIFYELAKIVIIFVNFSIKRKKNKGDSGT